MVWSAGNDVAESDASAMAGLPELFPDLGEAWIVANVVQYTGDSIYQMQLHQNLH